MRVAFSHDWLNGMRGGEKCLEALCELYPESDLYTLFYEKGKVSDIISRHRVFSSRIEKFPLVYKLYRRYLPFFPGAIESFSLKDYDLVISTSHCVAKGIRPPAGARHLCYCFTPMRYAWGFFDEYFGQKNPLEKSAIRFFIERLKRWDLKANARVDLFVAISEHVRSRIRRCYGCPAEVVYPPVDTEYFSPSADVARQEAYVAVSALVPYKRMDLAIGAFNELGKTLVIIGDGPERQRLERIAGPHINFLGWQPDAVLRDYFRKAKALIFPGEEDFGIVPVEMQSCGGPVIAYGRGGALETVLENETGIFFNEPVSGALAEAVRGFEKRRWTAETARRHALKFSRERFKLTFSLIVQKLMSETRGGVL